MADERRIDDNNLPLTAGFEQTSEDILTLRLIKDSEGRVVLPTGLFVRNGTGNYTEMAQPLEANDLGNVDILTKFADRLTALYEMVKMQLTEQKLTNMYLNEMLGGRTNFTERDIEGR